MPEEEKVRPCSICGHPAEAEHAFCPNCGAKTSEREADRVLREKSFYKKRILVTIGLVIFYILGNYLLWKTELSIPPPLPGFFFLFLIGGLVRHYRDDLRGALGSFHIRWSSFLYLGLQLLFSILVLYSIHSLEAFFGMDGERDPLSEFRYSRAPLLTALLAIAVLPPINEEIAFRGLLFGQLSRVTSVTACILVSSFLFAWVHFSFVSILWLFPEGLYLGWVRYKEGTVWTCMLCHALHNALAIFWVI